jgi:two-component system, sensor histidine kinase and response regulator
MTLDSPAVVDTEILDRPALIARFDGDLDLLREIAEMFLEDCPRRVADLRDAVARHDGEAIERAAHSLKGSVSNFAATAAWQVAQQVEQLARTGNVAAAEQAYARLEYEIARLLPVLADVAGARLDGRHVDAHP